MTMQHILSAILAAVFFLSTMPALAEMKSEWVEYSHGNTKLKAYMAYDDKITGRRPAVLVAHARSGMSPQTLKLTDMWAKLGYVSFAADIFGYGQGVLPKTTEEMAAQTEIYRKNRELLRARTYAGYDALIKHPIVDGSKVALIGYCFGGAVGIEFGSTGVPLLANVSIHGSFGDHAPGWARNAKGMFLILHGTEDEGYPLPVVDKVIQELRTAKVPFQLEIYSGTAHGFSNPKNKAEERANAQSIASTARTLKEVFGTGLGAMP
jgi:dienelactone hydrolase